MVSDKLRLFSVVSINAKSNSSNIKEEFLLFVIIAIIIVAIITIIWEYLEGLFCCRRFSRRTDDHEKNQDSSNATEASTIVEDSFFILLIQINGSIKRHRFEPELGSTIILPPCLSALGSSNDDITTILFKSDSGELLSMNGKLISNNPRLMIRNLHSSELVIKSIELEDEGQYECRTDQTINYILHLIVINSSTIHLTVFEGSNITLQCAEKGMWIIEESHRGGPVRTQYTTELILTNVQRDDDRFQTVICSTRDGHEKRKYLFDVIYKPTVKLVMLDTRLLMCTICAHPLPHRIQWWWHRRKERDDSIHQTNINQSCIAEQFTFVPENGNDLDQIIVCEAENIYGTARDSLQLKKVSITRSLKYTIQQSLVTSPNIQLTAPIFMTNQPSCCHQTVPILSMISLLIILSITIGIDSQGNEFILILSL